MATTIIQPRLDSTSSAEYTVDELLRWGNDYVRPRAKLAMEGKGEQKAGEHCRFCKAKTVCYTRGRANMDFANKYHDKPRNRLSDKEIADILAGADELQKWLKDVTEYALQEAENGKKWPGFKLVEGRSNRVYSDTTPWLPGLRSAAIRKQSSLNATCCRFPGWKRPSAKR